MKIYVSPKKLTLTFWQIRLKILGVLFILISGYLALNIFTRYQLTCAIKNFNVAKQCQFIREQPIFGKTVKPLGDITKAKVYLTFRVWPIIGEDIEIINSEGQTISLKLPQNQSNNFYELRDKINFYIKQSLSEHYPFHFVYSLLQTLIIIILPFVGLYLLFASGYYQIIVDNHKQLLILSKKTLLSQQEVHYPKEQIKALSIDYKTYTWRLSKFFFFWLTLTIKPNRSIDSKQQEEKVSLLETKTTNLKSLLKTAKKINDYLDKKSDFSAIQAMDEKRKKGPFSFALYLIFALLLLIALFYFSGSN
jgi:hypothetical protein